MKRVEYILDNDYIGFFAYLTWVLELLLFSDEHDIIPKFKLKGINFVDDERGSNWFDYFFVMKNDFSSKIVDKSYYINSIDDLSKIKHFRKLNFYDKKLRIESANKLFFKYIGVRNHILELVEEFFVANINKKNVLGVHYRGTDRMRTRIPYSKMKKKIEKEIHKKNIEVIFISTDEYAFIDYIKNKFKDKLVVTREKEAKPNNNPIFRRSDYGNYNKGLDAIVNVLILSKCNLIIKTVSIYSGWAKIFNPDLEVNIITPPYYDWFPEREIYKEQVNFFYYFIYRLNCFFANMNAGIRRVVKSILNRLLFVKTC